MEATRGAPGNGGEKGASTKLASPLSPSLITVLELATKRGLDLERYFGSVTEMPLESFTTLATAIGVFLKAGRPLEERILIDRGLGADALVSAVSEWSEDGDGDGSGGVVHVKWLLQECGVFGEEKDDAFQLEGEVKDGDEDEELDERVRRLVNQADRYQHLRSLLGLIPPPSAALAPSDWDQKLSETSIRKESLLAALRATSFSSWHNQSEGGGETRDRYWSEADAAAVMARVAGGFIEKESITAKALSEYLLRLRLQSATQEGRSRQAQRGGVLGFEAWGERIRGEERKRDKERQHEFQRALAGRKFHLNATELEELLTRFEIMTPEMAKQEMIQLATLWLKGIEGKRRVRLQLSEWEAGLKSGQAGLEELKGASATDLSRRARRACWEAKKSELAEAEDEHLAVSKQLLQSFLRENRLNGYKEGLPFGMWLKRRWKARKKAHELDKARDKVDSLARSASAGQTALVEEVKEELEGMVNATKKMGKLAGGVQLLRSSRDGLELGKKIRALGSRDSRLVSKEVFDRTMDDVLFSLTADKQAASKAKELGGINLASSKVRTRVKAAWEEQPAGTPFLLPDPSALGVPLTSGLFSTNTDELVARSLVSKAEKMADADKKYKSWVKKKDRQRRAEKKGAKAAEKQIEVNVVKAWHPLALRFVLLLHSLDKGGA
ncbi:unnamed protein product [Chrysoparadoxa australica]